MELALKRPTGKGRSAWKASSLAFPRDHPLSSRWYPSSRWHPSTYPLNCCRHSSLDFGRHAMQGTVDLEVSHYNPRFTSSSNMTPEEFKAAVASCKEYIAAGDIFQVGSAQLECPRERNMDGWHWILFCPVFSFLGPYIYIHNNIQVVLSQRFERRTFADPFEIYRALRIVNPSPYMIYIQVCRSIGCMEFSASSLAAVCCCSQTLPKA